MRTSNVARFVEGELDPEGGRAVLVVHPSTAGALRRAALQPDRPHLGSTKSEKQGGPGTPVNRADAPKTEGTSTSVGAQAFQRFFLIATAILLALSSALLVQRHSQRRDSTPVAAHAGQLSSNEQASATALLPQSKAPVIVLTSPPKLEGKVGEEIRFPISIDATEALPARSLVAVSSMPEGASFSEGRPYGMTGWSLRPDEIGDLRLLLPKAKFGSYDMSIELLAGDGGLLGKSETRLRVSYENEMLVASADVSEITTSTETFALPSPENKVTSEITASPKITTVKTLAIDPGTSPRGAAEWVLVVSSVNVHPSPNRSSKTIRVAKKGVKLRVLARKKGWVQVSDPTTLVKGWVYRRFVKAAEPPA
jgi:hypothetical protein